MVKTNIKTVVLITTYWKNSPGGGVKTYLTGLASSLQGHGIDVKVVFREGSDENNYKITGSRYLFPFKAFKTLLIIKPQAVHSHGTWYCLMVGVLYKVLHRQKLIHTFHTSPNRPLPIYGRWLMQSLVNRCDCVTFVSKALKADIESVYKLNFKTTAITYAGVSPGKVETEEIEAFIEKFNISPESIILLAQGFTANKQKAEGMKLLIRVLKKLLPKYPKLLLIATRGGVYSKELKAVTEELNMGNHVLFTGDVENVFTPVKIANIYTHISLSEGGVSLSLLEAMVSEKPVIATNIGGIPEAIENMKNGILVEPEEDALLRAIKLLLSNKELAKECSKNAKLTAEDKFTWEKTIKQFLNIYQGTA